MGIKEVDIKLLNGDSTFTGQVLSSERSYNIVTMPGCHILIVYYVVHLTASFSLCVFILDYIMKFAADNRM